MRTENGVKIISAAKLIELLQTLPPDSHLIVNSVGNLMVRDAEEWYAGYVDFHYERAVMYSKDPDDGA